MASGTKQDIVNSLRLGAEEIKQLRKRNELLDAKVEVVEVFAAALGLKRGPQGYGEDVAWRLSKHAEALEADIERDKAMAGMPKAPTSQPPMPE